MHVSLFHFFSKRAGCELDRSAAEDRQRSHAEGSAVPSRGREKGGCVVTREMGTEIGYGVEGYTAYTYMY